MNGIQVMIIECYRQQWKVKKERKTGQSCLHSPSQDVDLQQAHLSTTRKEVLIRSSFLHLPPSEPYTVFPVAAQFPSSVEAAESSCD